jgi:hypothetical protein
MPRPASGIRSPHQHRNGQCKIKYCGRQAPAVLTLVLAAHSKNGRSPPDRRISVCQAVELPTCPHTKLNPTAKNPKDAAYPAQTPNYVELTGFPEVRRISRYTPICAIIPAALHAAEPSPTPDLDATNRRPALPSKPSHSGNRPTGHRRPIPSRSPRTKAPKESPHRTGHEPAEIVVAWSAPGPHGSETRWSQAGTSGHGRPLATAGSDALHRGDIGRRSSPAPGSSPHPNSCRRPAALANEAGRHRGPASPRTPGGAATARTARRLASPAAPATCHQQQRRLTAKLTTNLAGARRNRDAATNACTAVELHGWTVADGSRRESGITAPAG